jgi:aspartyl/asparaginyl-tRNA synthetase
MPTRVRIGGLVARQRPGTAGGVVFVLLQDEFGVVNLIVPPAVYERHQLTVRTEQLLLVEGRLERHAQAGGAINVLVNRVDQIGRELFWRALCGLPYRSLPTVRWARPDLTSTR